MLEKFFEVWDPIIKEHLAYCKAHAFVDGIQGCNLRRYLRFHLCTMRNCKSAVFPTHHFPAHVWELMGPERL